MIIHSVMAFMADRMGKSYILSYRGVTLNLVGNVYLPIACHLHIIYRQSIQ